MDCCPYCQRQMARRYDKWSREEILILMAEIKSGKYGASKRAASVLGREPTAVKAMMDRISRGTIDVDSFESSRLMSA